MQTHSIAANLRQNVYFQLCEITFGSQQAVDLIARLLLASGAEVLLEDPGSKSTHPGLRQGFAVLSNSLVESFARSRSRVRARALSDRHAPGAVQDVLSRLFLEARLLRYLRRMRDMHRSHQSVLTNARYQGTDGALQSPTSLQGTHLAHEVRQTAADRAFS